MIGGYLGYCIESNFLTISAFSLYQHTLVSDVNKYSILRQYSSYYQPMVL